MLIDANTITIVANCLLISNKFRCSQVNVILDVVGVEIVCVDLFCKHETVRLIVCYYRSTLLARTSLDVNNKIIHCLNKLCHVKHSVLLVGDFYLPNISWNSNHTPSDSIHLAFLECFLLMVCSNLIISPLEAMLSSTWYCQMNPTLHVT